MSYLLLSDDRCILALTYEITVVLVSEIMHQSGDSTYGQLYDTLSGAPLFDAVTGAPLTW